MNASKILTAVIAAGTIVGAARFVSAQTSGTDPASAGPTSTEPMTSPAPYTATTPAASSTTDMSTTPASSNDALMSKAEPQPKADRN